MEASVVASPVAAASSIAESRTQFKGKYSYNSLHFPGDGDKFRGRLASAKEKVVLWLEDKASKGQWQCEIDVAKCGPAGIPEETVITLLHRGLELIEGTSDGAKTSGDDPVVIKSEDSITLILSIGGGIWKPQYVFPLVPIAIDAVAILEAKVRDLEESNRDLMQSNAALVELVNTSANRNYMNLFSDVSTTCGADIDWRAEHPLRHLPPDFSLSDDGKVVTAELAALYELHVSVACRNNSNSKTLQIWLNESEISECYQNDANAYICHVNAHLIIRLKKGDRLHVTYTGNSSTLNCANGNSFSLLRIGS